MASSLSPDNPIPGQEMHVKKKRELFPGHTLASPGLVVLPHIIHVSVQKY